MPFFPYSPFPGWCETFCDFFYTHLGIVALFYLHKWDYMLHNVLGLSFFIYTIPWTSIYARAY